MVNRKSGLHPYNQPSAFHSSQLKFLNIHIEKCVSQCIKRAADLFCYLQNMRIEHRGLKIAVTEQKLNRPNIGSSREQLRGKRMT